MKRTLALLPSIAAILAGCGSTTDLTHDSADAHAADAAQNDASTDAGGDATDGGVTDGSARDGDAADARAIDAASFACGTQTCAGGDVCVRTYTTGGACLICGDGGACPAGRHCGGQCCVEDVPSYAYACRAAPAACASGLSCSAPCGSGLCATGACPCEAASGNTATCHCLAP